MDRLRTRLLCWYDENRRPLPWRMTDDPYAIWVSEIMLQQTRAETVIGYWQRFLARFPTIQSLAAAPEEDVLKAWEGLGYYSRARNLQRCAQLVTDRMAGRLPSDVAALRALPGIGEYTAGAIASIVYGVRTPAVDGNVERVVSRLCGIREDIGIPSVRRRLRTEAAALVPEERPGDFNQAMMELGARICQPAPRCEACPIQRACDAYGAGDADALPIKQRKAPQRILPRGIALVTRQGRILLYRREEKLLHGLWCFPDFDRATDAGGIERMLRAQGITARFVAAHGEAKHVFTHLIWQMHLHHFEASSDACPAGWRWATHEELHALPMPTAVKAARAIAEALLRAEEGRKELANAD